MQTVRQEESRHPHPAAASRPRAVALCLLLGILAAGCTEHIDEYTQFGGWGESQTRSTVISGTPNADAIAYGASLEVLNDNDWRVLEKIAPRPIWERIARMRQLFEMREKASHKPVLDGPHRAAVVPDVPVTELADGKVRIFYRLQNYGGPEVISQRDGGTSRHRISLKASDLAPLVNLLNQELAGKGKVTPLPAENALVVTCEREVKDSALQLIAEADAPPTQVEINVRICEVSHDFDFQWGAQARLKHHAADINVPVGCGGVPVYPGDVLVSTFSAQGFLDSLSNTQLGDFAYQGSALRLMKVFTDAGITVDATFQALANMGLVKVVASPRMTVAAGKTAYMLAGQELPIQSAKISNDKIISEKVDYKPVGVQLYITPQATAGRSVKMHVLTSVTAVAGFAPQATINGQSSGETITNPIIDSREAETFVTVDDGDTLVIGGLRMVRTVTREKKIPGLGQIPGLEWLFKNHRSQNNVSDLYFFVQPRVVSVGGPAAPAEAASPPQARAGADAGAKG